MKNKISLTLSFLAGIFLLNSCLKDSIGEYWKNDLAGKAYATVAVATLQQMALKPVAGEVTYKFLVNIATDALPTEDITVTLAVDPTAVSNYNKMPGVTKVYKSMPTVALVSPTLVIKAGTRNGYVNAKVWGAETLNACDSYMAAISIVSAKTASGTDIPVAANMKSYLVSLPISNPYAADYRVLGYRKHPSLGIFTVDKTVTCATVDCKTIIKNQMGDYPYDVKIEITTNPITVQGVTCYKVNVVTIDPSTGEAVSSGVGMYNTFTGAATQVPIPTSNDVNYYNPVTKTFVLNYYYNSSAPRIAYEVLTRL